MDLAKAIMSEQNQTEDQLNWREVVELGIQPLDNEHESKDSEDEQDQPKEY